MGSQIELCWMMHRSYGCVPAPLCGLVYNKVENGWHHRPLNISVKCICHLGKVGYIQLNLLGFPSWDTHKLLLKFKTLPWEHCRVRYKERRPYTRWADYFDHVNRIALCVSHTWMSSAVSDAQYKSQVFIQLSELQMDGVAVCHFTCPWETPI